MIEPFHQLCYESENKSVCCRGITFNSGDSFATFLTDEVSQRLEDTEEKLAFESHLTGLVGTGFAKENLQEILESDITEERNWAAGEALAEAWLEYVHKITWPWNMERDKRTPKASLPGADLVGFQECDKEIRLVLGEVKSSSQEKYPPNVMTGKSGMEHQIDKLATDLSIVARLLRWLFPRCKGNQFEASFNSAVQLFLESGNKAVSLFGVLIRDTEPNELDLKNRGQTLKKCIQSPTSCDLLSLYLPFSLNELSERIQGVVPS
ncbi:MAG: hypothetical protein MJE63_21965 [Proteobacteria bacterium]|nr:hypothetical protein [Pseudomonadota bacterium]